MTGKTESFDTPQGAAAAFYAADAQERPGVIYGNVRSAQILARTMTIGDRIEKSLPYETDPLFTEAYLALRKKRPGP